MCRKCSHRAVSHHRCTLSRTTLHPTSNPHHP
ncbi:hypothetical protein CGRA01v4_06288 [Colletotrichum graminicola]|nr:hypothetical protein CGRA01v4_06288 [Colletotrichum graminicola]